MNIIAVNGFNKEAATCVYRVMNTYCQKLHGMISTSQNKMRQLEQDVLIKHQEFNGNSKELTKVSKMLRVEGFLQNFVKTLGNNLQKSEGSKGALKYINDIVNSCANYIKVSKTKNKSEGRLYGKLIAGNKDFLKDETVKLNLQALKNEKKELKHIEQLFINFKTVIKTSMDFGAEQNPALKKVAKAKTKKALSEFASSAQSLLK